MEFIIDNLVWFIAGGVIILMTIIGYFAEKTDFGKNLSSEKSKDGESVEPKKEKHTKKEKTNKKDKETNLIEKKEEILQNQPVDEQFTSELPIPVINANPITLEEQNIEPVALEPMETAIAENIPTELSENPVVLEEQNVEPVAVEPTETAVAENIPMEINNEPITQEVVPVDLQSAAIEDNNIEIQPALEAEPIPQIFSEPVVEIPTIENVVPDELPAISDETDNINSVVQLDNLVEEPEDMPIVLPDSNDLENSVQPIPTMDETPVVITDEKVLPFDELAGNMDVSPIAVEQGIPALNMELPNLEAVTPDGMQSDEEDIWKF